MDGIFKPCNALHGDPSPNKISMFHRASPCLKKCGAKKGTDFFPSNVNPGLINHGLWQLGGYSPNSRFIWYYLNGTFPMSHSRKRGLLIQGWHYWIDGGYDQLRPKLSTGWGLRKRAFWRSVDIRPWLNDMIYMVVMAHIHPYPIGSMYGI